MTDTPDTPDRDADARIDALARTAGADLRRPAPADGLARVAKAKQRHQAVRAGAAGTAVIALVAIGTMALRGGDENTVVPATVSTVESPETTVVASTVPSTTDEPVSSSTEPPPDSSSPTTSVEVPPNAAGQPSAVYTAATPVAFADGDQTLVDPVTGEVLGAEPMDADASRAAQDALLGGSSVTGGVREATTEWFTYDYAIGGTTFTIEALPSEVTYLDLFAPATLERFDRCGQSTLVVSGASASAVPMRALGVTFSPDGKWLVTRSVDCPPGTLADGAATIDTDFTFQLFDTSDLDTPGRRVFTGVGAAGFDRVTFSPDSRFVALSTFGETPYQFVDLADGEPVAPFLDDCPTAGTKWSRFIGPWIGQSSVALRLACEGGDRLVVHDLATSEHIEVDSPAAAPFSTSFDVDFAHYDRPANVWFTMCVSAFDAGTSTQSFECWIGQGGGPVVELPGSGEASFLPLGFTYGG